MPTFEIDPDIRKAKTLPSEFYTEERFFELSREKIFARAWHFLGRADEFESLKPATLLPGFLDEPVLLAKTDAGVTCLSNVCTHRGKILVEEPCSANLIRCGYHGRRFSLDGKFLSMPEFDGVENFPSETDNLSRLPLGEWDGFLFASIGPFAAFEKLVADFADTEFVYDELKLTSTKSYEVNAHWALYCENYLEGFHIPYVHKSLNEIVDYGTYTTETFRYASVQTASGNAGIPARMSPMGENDVRASHSSGQGCPRSDNVAARYLFIFPNLMFNFYPWGVSVNVVRPVTSSKSVVEFMTYVSDESLLNAGASADLNGVELEDEAVVESVQRGIRSRFYTHGRYSPTREQGTHHFHRLIAEFMN